MRDELELLRKNNKELRMTGIKDKHERQLLESKHYKNITLKELNDVKGSIDNDTFFENIRAGNTSQDVNFKKVIKEQQSANAK